MNWRLIVALGATGLLVGLASALVGMRDNVEFAFWTALYFVWAGAIIRTQAPRPILTGVLSGALAGLCAGAVQTVLLDQYRTHNPWYPDLPTTIGSAAVGFVLFGVLAGATFGLIFGTFAAIWLRRWPPTPAAG